jgi:transcriptional regulator with GAF, ATPase, and Fis domain
MASVEDDDDGTPVGLLRPVEVPAFRIQVIEGPDAGLTITIDGTRPSRAHVGKSTLSALRLTDPQVSRNHLALDVHQGTLRLVDCGSTNGTTVNGVWVRECRLTGGESIRLGDTALRVEALGQSLLPASSQDRFGPLLGASLEMSRIYPLLERLARSDVPVLIEGETGTGKEVVAEAIHAAGARSKRELVVFDCTAVAPTLMESALFGHERGAFTGAVTASEGVFEAANGGTLLLDEIGDLDLQLQPKLLRAIERSEIRRVGGSKWIHVDVRVMSATRRDLELEIQNGRFRDDLFYRLAVARVELPPLRERRGDVAFLARHFWRTIGDTTPIPPDFQRGLETYDWPGNVRELRNFVARRLALGDLAPAPGDRPSRSSAVPPAPSSQRVIEETGDVIERVLQGELPLSASRDLVIQEFERRYLARALDRNGGDATSAARAAGVARRYFQLLRGKRGL